MRVLLTGAAGFIGSTLAERLVARGDEVTGFDSLDATLYPAATKREHLQALLQAPTFRFVEGDVLNDAQVDALVPGVDAVVHAAALPGVRPSLADPLRWARVNVEGTRRLIDAAVRAGVRRIVFLSSSSVYASGFASVARPLAEDDPADTQLSPYGASKRRAELVALASARTGGLAVGVARLFSVYGPRQRPDMGIHQFLRAMVEDRPITCYGDGTSARDYTYIDDAVDGLVRVLDRTASLEGARIWNLGSGHPVSLARLIELLGQAVGRPARLKRLPMQPGDVDVTHADNRRARDELGWEPRVSIEEGLRRFVASYGARPNDELRTAHG